jgi:quercetin dioxygenase-like cupin family protein
MTERHASRTEIVLSALAALIFAGVLLASQSEPAAQQSNFVGGSPTRVDSQDLTLLRLRFKAGSRSNWHSHEKGQLLMIEQGHGLTQERGKPVRVVGPGQPWYTPPGVEHWHGASPDEDVVQLTIYGGAVKWLEPVTDAEYRATPQP